VNSICDHRAKLLINSKLEEYVAFPFTLNSTYATDGTMIILDKSQLYHHISVQ